MTFLIAGFISSALVSIVLKLTSRYEYDRYGMLTVNYLSGLIPFIISEVGNAMPSFDSALLQCFLFALLNGSLYIIGMVLNDMNVRKNGAILQATFSRLGIMVPTLVSIFFFKEMPTALQITGLVLVPVAFLIMNIPEKKDYKEKSKPVFSLLVLALLFCGLAESMLKVFEVFGSSSLDSWFMSLTFLSAAFICLALTIAKKGRIGKKEALIGIALGVPNYLSSFFLLKALSSVSAYIAYPTYSVGAILVVSAASILIFKERLLEQNALALLIIISALVLLNI